MRGNKQVKRAKHFATKQAGMFLREGVETKTEQKIQKSDLDPSSDNPTCVSHAYIIQSNENIRDLEAHFFFTSNIHKLFIKVSL